MDAFLNQLQQVTKTKKSLKVSTGICSPCSVNKFLESSLAILPQRVLSPGPQEYERPVSRDRDSLLLSKIQNFRGSSGKLKKLIDFLKEAVQLEQEIFQMPNDIKTLLPEYYTSLKSDNAEYKERLHKLAKKLDEASLNKKFHSKRILDRKCS
jgi:hypothetical protein